MIRCDMLTAGYGRINVIKDISWEAAGGRLTAIIGPNGSGKSTLLKSVMGQTVIKNGCICLDGRPFRHWTNREIAKRIAYLPQSRNDTNISVFRMALHGRFPYLSYPRHYTKQDEEMVIKASERMGIHRLLDKPVSELSGGEKQRAYLTMALVQDSSVLLLDEPTTCLDISAQLELLGILKELTAEGKTVVVVLHDLNQALQCADEIVLMEDGKLLQYGKPKEILEADVLEKVFHVRVHVLQDQYGKEHYCFS